MQTKRACANALKTKALNTKSSNTKAAKILMPGDDDEDDVDIDTARNQIALRLHQLISNTRQLWRTCDQRVCRRARQCCASQAYCAARERARPADPEQVARTMALFHRMVKAQEERLDAEEDARLRNESHKKS